MSSRDSVYDLVERITLRRKTDIRDTDRLGEDLRMDPEDFSMSLVPRLEKALHLKPPIQQWERVRTVGDVIQLLERASKLSG